MAMVQRIDSPRFLAFPGFFGPATSSSSGMPAIRMHEHRPAQLDPLGDFFGAWIASLHGAFLRDSCEERKAGGSSAAARMESISLPMWQ
jgi:hypothetical protein